MNKVIPRLERLEKNGKSIDAIRRKWAADGIYSLTDDELLCICSHKTGIDFSKLTDEELDDKLYRIATSDKKETNHEQT